MEAHCGLVGEACRLQAALAGSAQDPIVPGFEDGDKSEWECRGGKMFLDRFYLLPPSIFFSSSS